MLHITEEKGRRILEYTPGPVCRGGESRMPFDNRFSPEKKNFCFSGKGLECIPEIKYTKRGGGSYIYSNNPEMLAADDVGRAILRTDGMSGRYMFTFEHSNYTGVPLYLGYRLYNTGAGDMTVTVMNIGLQTDGEWLGQRSWSDFYNLPLRLPEEYFLPDGSVNPVYVGCDYVDYAPRVYIPQTVTVPPGEYVYVLGGTSADAYGQTDFGATADRVLEKGRCGNGAVLFEISSGEASGLFCCYTDPAQIDISAPGQEYVVSRDGKDYSAQYKGIDRGNIGLVESGIVWAVDDHTNGRMPVVYKNLRDPGFAGKNAPYAPYSPKEYVIRSDSWITSLNPNTCPDAVGSDMMVFECTAADGSTVTVDNFRADGAGRPANTGNWMTPYTDCFTFINAGSRPRRFRIFKKGAVSGALAVILRSDDGSILGSSLKCHPYVYEIGAVPDYADRSLLEERDGMLWYRLNGVPYWQLVDERALAAQLTVAPGGVGRISVDYLILGNSNGGILHWVEVE